MREAIEDLLAAYAEAIDDGEIERWPGFFTEDGVYQIITREGFDARLPIGIFYCDSRGMMEDRVRALRTANIYEPHAYRHLLGRSQFERRDGGFDVRSNFCVFRIAQDGDTVIFATGRYLDRLVDDGGALRFSTRRVGTRFAPCRYPAGAAAVAAARKSDTNSPPDRAMMRCIISLARLA